MTPDGIPYSKLPVGVSPAVLEVLQQEAKNWERRADRLEKDWEIERIQKDALLGKLSRIASAAGNPDPAEACRVILRICRE